ncbi:hypothetical protein NPX13_g5695 [Xylaria arbuscula]|uniref:Uncharacterized protein n=1 Tax=Xylaria arbuscula TaxID=114810 RepID=A0A9W8NDY6_9PEZI|nr:hypothetical protein NPX13_g5695 [Xylaria arbuscula]
MTFGGMWSLFNARDSMLEFGLPRRIANIRGTASVFQVGNARTTVIGLLVFYFYLRNQFAVVDTIMAITGAYCGLIDSYVVWREGNGKKALFRLLSSGVLSAWGYWGLTAGW